MKKLQQLLTVFPLLIMPLHLIAEPFSLASEKNTSVMVNNRILANVNGKSISVVDLMKKMDILFYREFPEYASIPQARYQFYIANWKSVLKEMIDKELIVADSEEAKLPMSSGDVRQEMERIFGPNIIGNLDTIGMSFDEATAIVQGDLIIQRMLYVRVNSKALRNVTPLDVRNYYEEYIKDNKQPASWTYRVVTVRSKDTSLGAETANSIYHLLVTKSLPLSDLEAKIKTEAFSQDSQISISEEFHHGEKEISPAYKETLLLLNSGTYSKPVAQQSRADKSTVFRLFFLKEYKPESAPPYGEIEAKLKNTLLEKQIVTESTAYLKRLRRHFDVQEMIPEDFQPFSIN
ncbi:MAG: peptidyl-prolyl cis-trans isomerase [Parachlamydiaceae bacterium]|nr:peptidyl-prolyl cis-trans isomerase [Parachlamydiaceae bacterium]